jgi:hypothetical protein
MPPRDEQFTFAVVGRNEAASLRYPLDEVIARQPPVGRPDEWFQRELDEAISQPLPAA